jgi:hypothetical protein
MVKLFCFVVGEKGDAFSINIEESESVAELKKFIKQKKANKLKNIDARKLDLFLALTFDNKWLDIDSDDANRLEYGEKTDLIEELTQENRRLKGAFGLHAVLKKMPKPELRQIHILVVIPEQERRPALPQIFPTYQPHIKGIHLKLPYLSREELVEDLYNMSMSYNFV